MTNRVDAGSSRWRWHSHTCVLILLGVALRAAPLLVNRFHTDEALFATLARTIVSHDDFLLAKTTLLVDKPPLAYYSLALLIALGGNNEIAIRLPAFLSSVITMALVVSVSYATWRNRVSATVALAIIAVSPYAIAFAPTAFSDSVMVMCILASILADLWRRTLFAGALIGFAILFKQNALLFVPLTVLIYVMSLTKLRPQIASTLRFGGGFCTVILFALLWEIMRQPAANSWVTAAAVNNPGRLARSTEILQRGDEWLAWASIVAGSPIVGLVLLVAIAAAVYVAITELGQRSAADTLIFNAYMVGYLSIQWLVAFPILDRYLLPCVPFLAILSGQGLAVILQTISRRAREIQVKSWISIVASAMTILLVLPWSVQASANKFPVGGDHGSNDGIDSVAAFSHNLPLGTVVYSHRLDWLVRYYFFDEYIFPVYLDTPRQFNKDLSVFGSVGPRRLLLLSVEESMPEFERAAKSAGYTLIPVLYGIGRDGAVTMTVYAIEKRTINLDLISRRHTLAAIVGQIN